MLKVKLRKLGLACKTRIERSGDLGRVSRSEIFVVWDLENMVDDYSS